MGNKPNNSLNWDQFKALGNPENAPDEPVEVKKPKYGNFQVRVHYEKKGRGGKEAIIIRGIEMPDSFLSEICKKIKSKIGVGGSAKDNEIILQGNQREKIMKILKDEGFVNVKPAGG
ncbi:MAG TPA: translation initiation factor [Saprospiraceae bacterium]|mgnify:CR=1 FL=1|nr:translation initiation factor [Saprospiraceae bacterium]HPN71507.1 translation initiation factor [Saprospiraceae bacterium]